MPQPRQIPAPASNRPGWQRAALLPVLLVLFPVLLNGGRAEPFSEDPVDRLGKVLVARPRLANRTFTDDAQKEAYEEEIKTRSMAHKAAVVAASKDLKSIDQLTRAVTLKEWQGEGQRMILDQEAEVRSELKGRLTAEVKRVFQKGTPAERVALCVYLSESAVEARKSTQPNVKLIQLCREFVPQVLEAARDGNADVSLTAIRTLGQIQGINDETAPQLTKWLASPDPAVRNAASDAILGAAQVVTTSLRDSNTVTTSLRDPLSNADTQAANREEFRTTGRLLAVLAAQDLKDPDPAIRTKHIETLHVLASELRDEAKQLGNRGQKLYNLFLTDFQKIVTQLPSLEAQRDEAVRQSMVEIIRDVGQARVSLAEIKPADLSPYVPGAPGRPDPTVPPGIGTPPGPGAPGTPRIMPLPPADPSPTLPGNLLAPPFSRRPEPSAVRRVAWQAPQDFGALPEAELKTFLNTLVAGLKDKDPQTRLMAIEALATLGDQARPALGNLLEATNDPNVFVRWATFRTLGRLRLEPDRVVPVLAAHLNERDVDVRKVAALAIARFGPKAVSAVEPLAQSVTRGDAEYRIQGFRALEAIGTEAAPALPAIASNVTNPDRDVRLTAVQLLGRFGPLAAAHLRTVEKALADPEPDIRKAAAVTILRIRGL